MGLLCQPPYLYVVQWIIYWKYWTFLDLCYFILSAQQTMELPACPGIETVNSNGQNECGTIANPRL